MVLKINFLKILFTLMQYIGMLYIGPFMGKG